MLYNCWEASGFDVDETGQRQMAGLAAELGVELYVMDDGWFRGRTDDRAGLGDWWPDPVRFPRGLGPLIAEVHRLGMRFGLWVDPEMGRYFVLLTNRVHPSREGTGIVAVRREFHDIAAAMC